MTNEQLAIFLRGQVTQLDGIIDELVEALSSLEVERETESHYQWIGEGEEPLVAFPSMYKGYELVHDFGDPTMLMPLKAFKAHLEENINTLVGGE